MKLVKIKDVRVGQIWKIHNMLGVIELINSTYLSLTSIARITLFPGAEPETECIFNIIGKHELIGFLGITHEIKDNKLVEIPREEFEVDDIVNALKISCNKKENTVIVKKTGYEINTFSGESLYGYYTDDPDSKFFPKKIGVLGVTHEFVNERLVK